MVHRRIQSRITKCLQERQLMFESPNMTKASFYYNINHKNYIAYSIGSKLIIIGDFWHEVIAEVTMGNLKISKTRGIDLGKKDMAFINKAIEEFQKSNYRSVGQKSTCFVLRSYHFAHHIWNELSALDFYLAEQLGKENHKRIIHLLCIGFPLGKLESIFKEHKHLLEIHYVETQEQIDTIIDENNLFISPLGGVQVSARLISKLFTHSISNVSHDAKREIREFYNGIDHVIAISLKLGSKTVSETVEFTADLINGIHQLIPNSRFILYGMSYNMQRRKVKEKKYKNNLKKHVENIKVRLDNTIVCKDINGSSLLETICWFKDISFYISHVGTLHHFPAWFSSSHGIVHGSQAYLDRPLEFIPGLWEYDEAHPVEFIDIKNVRDIDEEVNLRGTFTKGTAVNYEILHVENFVQQIHNSIKVKNAN